MQVKKLEHELTFKKTTETFTFEVGGKQVRCYKHDYQDTIGSDYDTDLIWDLEDIKELTEEERDILTDNEFELLELETGEVYNPEK